MKLIRLAGLSAGLCFFALLLTGCGDTYRPIVNPVPVPGGDPQTGGVAYVLNQGVPTGGSSTCLDGTPPPCAGSATHINVSGDTNMGNTTIGRLPWHMMSISSTALVANRGDDTLSMFVTGGSVATVSLPSGSAPVFVHSSESSVVYTANSGTNNVSVISLSAPAVTSSIAAGSHPVALAETPNSSRLYAVNKGDGTVTVIATLDKKILGTIRVGSAPVWAIASADSNFVFVLNRGSNSVSVLSTANNVQPLGSMPVGASADVDQPLSNPMFYDSNAQRLYVANSNSDSVTVYDISTLPAGTVPTQPVATVQLPAGSRPVSVAVLADGSRFYTANQGNNTVSVVDARNFSVRKTIGITSISNGATAQGLGTNLWGLSVSGNGSKVYVINHDPTVVTDPSNAANSFVQQPGTSVIRTSDDTVAVNIPAPFADPVNCIADNPSVWKASTAFSQNAFVIPTSAKANGHVYKATTGGTSGSSEPNWCTTTGSTPCTVTDGTVTWTESGTRINCPHEQPSFVLTQ